MHVPHTDEHYFRIVTQYLLNQVTDRLLAVSPDCGRVRHEDSPDRPLKAEIETGWRCQTLFSAMYLQFYWLITEQTPMKSCGYCGSLFPVSKGDREYCSKSCIDKAYNRRRKKVRHLYDRGLSAEEIARQMDASEESKTGTKPSTIQGWVSKWDSEKGGD